MYDTHTHVLGRLFIEQVHPRDTLSPLKTDKTIHRLTHVISWSASLISSPSCDLAKWLSLTLPTGRTKITRSDSFGSNIEDRLGVCLSLYPERIGEGGTVWEMRRSRINGRCWVRHAYKIGWLLGFGLCLIRALLTNSPVPVCMSHVESDRSKWLFLYLRK